MQGFFGWFKYPHGQGLAEATSIKFAGYWTRRKERAMVTDPSSKGPRNASSTDRGNSLNSSKNNTPRCARLISPGWGLLPPPIKPTKEVLWWGERNGRWRSRLPPAAICPEAE